MHKGRGKTLQSDSCGAKEWGIDRGTDKGRERVGVKSRAGEREREREREAMKKKTNEREQRKIRWGLFMQLIDGLHTSHRAVPKELPGSVFFFKHRKTLLLGYN